MYYFLKCMLHFGIALWNCVIYNIYMKKTKYFIETGIGLQDVDQLSNSTYFLNEANRYINGEISLDELDNIVSAYYANKSSIGDRTEEADKISVRIAKLISENSFTFTVGQLLTIHKILFNGILKHPGEMRKYNFSKKEWVLGGASVVYGDYRELERTLQFDFELEKKFNYKDLSIDEIIEHLAIFISNLWQIHIFEEGNTRTVTVFFIKYLKSLGFDTTNDTFAKNSWYFRNALVRANYNNIGKGIFQDRLFLIKFLRNLILGETNILQNKDLHISQIKAQGKDTFRQSRIINIVKDNPKITIEKLAKEIGVSVRTIKSVLKVMENNQQIKRINGKRYGYWEVLN